MNALNERGCGLSVVRRWTICAAAAWLLTGVTVVEGADYPPRAGLAHPQIALRHIDGAGEVILSRHLGKKVLVIHFASFSAACRSQVPAWHRAAKPFVASGELAVVGVAHDVFADRARLWASREGIDWPIAHDPLNRLGVDRLPLVIGLDEDAYVRATGLTPDALEGFVKKDVRGDGGPALLKDASLPESRVTRRTALEAQLVAVWCEHGEALLLEGKPAQIDEAIDTFERAVAEDAKSAVSWFGLGAAYWTRFVRPDIGEPGDCRWAFDAWQQAARLAPDMAPIAGHVAALGPRMGRTAGSYHWIAEGGDAAAPAALLPGVSAVELAGPTEDFERERVEVPKLDRDVAEDNGPKVRIETSVMHGAGGDAARAAAVHLVLTPVDGARWPAGDAPIRVWLKRPRGGQVHQKYVQVGPDAARFVEGTRRVSFEVRFSEDEGVFEAYVEYGVEAGGVKRLHQIVAIEPWTAPALPTTDR